MESSLLLQKFSASDLQVEQLSTRKAGQPLEVLVTGEDSQELEAQKTAFEMLNRSDQVRRTLEIPKTALETLVKEQHSEASSKAQQRHDELLTEIKRFAPARPLVPLGEPPPPPPKERMSASALEGVVKRLEQQHRRTEELHERVLSDLDGATERRMSDRLEKLYARHEARLEALLVQNEKTMEEWMQQVRQVASKTGMRVSAVESKGSVKQDDLAGFQLHVGQQVLAKQSKNRVNHCSLDIAALSAVQGWKSLSEVAHGKASKLSKQSTASFPAFPRLRKLIQTTLDSISGVLVLLNLIFMGIDADVSLRSSMSGEKPPTWLWGMGALFLGLLLLELFARALLEQWQFITGPNQRWNLFDCVLAAIQILDLVLVFYNASFLRTLRIVRAVRVTRAFRTMRSVRELRIMIASISNSLPSLLWAFLLLFMALYTVSLVVVQSVVSHVQSKGVGSVHEKLFTYYGSMVNTMVSLFMAVSGGRTWAELMEPLEDISKIYVYGFVVFVTGTLLGMMNVLTAIFVDSTSKMSNLDREHVIQEHLDVKNSTAAHLRQLLHEADIDQSGTISKKEFLMKLSDPRFAAQLSALELDIHEAHGLFSILNYEENKDVPIEEFIYGLMRMKGTAKGVDMVTMLAENRRILAKLLAFMEFMDDSLQDLKVGLHIPGDTCLTDYVELSY